MIQPADALRGMVSLPLYASLPMYGLVCPRTHRADFWSHRGMHSSMGPKPETPVGLVGRRRIFNSVVRPAVSGVLPQHGSRTRKRLRSRYSSSIPLESHAIPQSQPMAPSRRQKATVHTDLKADRGDSSSDIMWDHAAGTQRAWLVKLQKSLSGIATHKTYASGNYCTSRGKTAVFSVEHAMAIDDVSINAGGHSIEKPMTLGTYKRTATVMTDALKDRFVIAPQVLEDEAANFLTDILDTMEGWSAR